MNESGLNSNFVDILWDVPGNDLLILSILRFLYTSNNFTVSLPIPIVLPIETSVGIWFTYISVVAAPGDASVPTIGVIRLA